MIRTPKFWKKISLLSLLLLPFSIIYFVIFFLIKITTKTSKISRPVICIGNIIAGGSGKTPTTIAIGKILQELKIESAFLSRGYMSDGSKFLLLNKNNKYDAKEVGDEPLLLAEHASTFISKNRLFGAKQIDAMNKFDCLVIDDGMQNESLFRDFTILVIDGKIGFGNQLLIPSGPMREPINWGLKKADLVVLIGHGDEKLLKKLSGKKIVNAKILPKNIENFKEQKLLAFCGLAYPEKFYSLLEKNNLQLAKTKSFPDHYNYSSNELAELQKEAKKLNAKLVTTKKDWIKFSPKFKKEISYLDIELQFEDKKLIKETLKKILKNA